MKTRGLKIAMRRLRADYQGMSIGERVGVAMLLIETAEFCVDGMREQMGEGATETMRRKAKRRETEVDPKSPVKPIRVAQPTKPKTPKYSGNHAPSANR